jgi:hypothetical protein
VRVAVTTSTIGAAVIAKVGRYFQAS